MKKTVFLFGVFILSLFIVTGAYAQKLPVAPLFNPSAPTLLSDNSADIILNVDGSSTCTGAGAELCLLANNNADCPGSEICSGIPTITVGDILITIAGINDIGGTQIGGTTPWSEVTIITAVRIATSVDIDLPPFDTPLPDGVGSGDTDDSTGSQAIDLFSYEAVALDAGDTDWFDWAFNATTSRIDTDGPTANAPNTIFTFPRPHPTAMNDGEFLGAVYEDAFPDYDRDGTVLTGINTTTDGNLVLLIGIDPALTSTDFLSSISGFNLGDFLILPAATAIDNTNIAFDGTILFDNWPGVAFNVSSNITGGNGGFSSPSADTNVPPGFPAFDNLDFTIKQAFCGDDFVDDVLGETCDPPGSVPDDPPGNANVCRNGGINGGLSPFACTYCGDGIRQIGAVDPIEECDDGNNINDDLCSNDCKINTCDVLVDKIIDCGTGPVDELLVSGNEDGTDGCQADNTEPITVSYKVMNDGDVPLVNCILSDSNKVISVDVSITTSITPGQTITVDPTNAPLICSDDLDAAEPDTLTITCDCTVPGGPFGSRSAFDIATFECLPICGDDEVNQSNETCDPPGEQQSNGNFCRNGGTLFECTYCGDTVLQEGAGETCDPPNAPAGPSGNTCRQDCTVCGDEIVNNVDEECDDGNNDNFDSCRNDCKRPFCGDEIIDPGETCDPPLSTPTTPPGNANVCRNDGPPYECTYCGDGKVQAGAGEKCDDGNNINDDNCDNTCQGICISKMNEPGSIITFPLIDNIDSRTHIDIANVCHEDIDVKCMMITHGYPGRHEEADIDFKESFVIHMTAMEKFWWRTWKTYNKRNDAGDRVFIPDYDDRKGYLFCWVIDDLDSNKPERGADCLKGDAVVWEGPNAFSYNGIPTQANTVDPEREVIWLVNEIGWPILNPDGTQKTELARVLNLDGEEYCMHSSKIRFEGFAENSFPMKGRCENDWDQRCVYDDECGEWWDKCEGYDPGVKGKLVVANLDLDFVNSIQPHFNITLDCWNQHEDYSDAHLEFWDFEQYDLTEDLRLTREEVGSVAFHCETNTTNPLWAIFYQTLRQKAWGTNVFQDPEFVIPTRIVLQD